MDMYNNDSRLGSEALEKKLREQIRAEGPYLRHDVNEALEADELPESERIARELLKKYLSNPPIKGVFGDLF